MSKWPLQIALVITRETDYKIDFILWEMPGEKAVAIFNQLTESFGITQQADPQKELKKFLIDTAHKKWLNRETDLRYQ